MRVDSANSAGCGPNGSRTFNPGVVGSNPTRPSKPPPLTGACRSRSASPSTRPSPQDNETEPESGYNRNHAPSRSFRITFYGLILSGVTMSTPF